MHCRHDDYKKNTNMRRLIFFWMIIFIFFTGAVYKKQNLLETDRAKDIFKDCLFRFHK